MVRKILEGVCIRKTSKYIPHASLWISMLFIELANRNDKICLTLDCSNTNRDGPGRLRSEADNPDNQLCYFNSAKDEQVYNEFVSKRIKSSVSDYQNLSFPNTPSEILKETNENNKIDQAAYDAFNERDTEISQELITTARNDLIKSITDEEGDVPTDVLNNITSSYELQQETTPEKNVRDHIQSTIKKNNKQYL